MIVVNKKSKLSIAIILVIVSLIIVGGSYAFFEAIVDKDANNTAAVTTKKLSINFQDGPEIVLNDVLPGQKIIKTFTVTNTGNTTQTYHLDFKDVVNEFSRKSDIVYSLTSTNGGATLNDIIFPSGDETFAIDISINPNVTQEYTMVIEYKNLSENQSVDMGKTASAKIQVTQIIKVSTNGDSLADILNNHQNLATGYYDFEVEGDNETVTYPVHLIVLDGDQVITTDTRYGDLDDCASGTDASDMAKNMVIVMVKGDYTVNSGVTVGPIYNEQYGGPKGFMLYVTGTLTNNGTIENNHGAYAVGQNVYLWKNANGSYEYVPAAGGSGGAAKAENINNYQARVYGNDGSQSTLARGTGGGASGEIYINASSSTPSGGVSGAGTAGTSYSGGSGGGSAAGVWELNVTASAAATNGGAGGNAKSSYGNTYYTAGGVGNPGGADGRGTSNYADHFGANGTGGLLIIYASDIVNNGNITANGTDATYYENYGNKKAYGGPSGGGSVNIIYTDTYSNSGTIEASGGKTDAEGTTGGKGSYQIGKITNNTYQDILLNTQTSMELYRDDEVYFYTPTGYTYEISDPSVISLVDEKITALSDGTATITIKKGSTTIKTISILVHPYVITFYRESGDDFNTVSCYDDCSLTDLQTVMFDGIDSRQGTYGAMLLSHRNNKIHFTVDKDIYVSFSSAYYSDSGGASGKYAIFSKIENGVETEYYRLEQLNNTKNYGKYLFTAGTYSLTLSADYIVFDEWHLSNS